jgi:hypothetical protein
LLIIYGALASQAELGVIPNTKKNNNQEKSNIINQHERQKNGRPDMAVV